MQVELFIAEISDEQIQATTQAAHELILNLLPQARASIKYDIPFYSIHKNICYLNPQAGHLVLGFYAGVHLSNAQGILQGDGKQVRHIYLYTPEDVFRDAVAEVILEAATYDEWKYGKKKSRH